jgi:hypothetical protein
MKTLELKPLKREMILRLKGYRANRIELVIVLVLVLVLVLKVIGYRI